MGAMSIRSTYSLDAETAQLIKRLAHQWDASQAEVIRRSVRLAARQAAADMMSPADVVAHYRALAAPRTWDETRNLAEELRTQRRAEGRARSARVKSAHP